MLLPNGNLPLLYTNLEVSLLMTKVIGDKVRMYEEIMIMNTDNLESSLQTSIY